VGYEKHTNGALDARRGGEDAFVEAILSGQPEPPLYFATMKRLNKEGAPVLGDLPQPQPWTAEDLARWLADQDADGRVVIDTRSDRQGFMASHLEGSLFAPLDRSFPATVGSYVREDQDIVLLVDPLRVDEAVRDLIRIGLDRIVAFASPSVLTEAPLASHLESLEILDFDALMARCGGDGVTVLDVRRATEFAAGALDGALNIAHTRLLARLDEVPRQGDILVHCRSGARAATATALLRRYGRRAWLVDGELASTLSKVA
jgi:hydroxyacylglutathione hydrolase